MCPDYTGCRYFSESTVIVMFRPGVKGEHYTSCHIKFSDVK